MFNLRFLSAYRNPRRKTPTVLQMEAVECGAAALAMVMGYHKKIVPLEELRIACGVSRDGSKASNIIRAARNYGFIAKGYRSEPGKLRDYPFPMIVHWNFNHFVVLEGFHKGFAYLNDPGSGPKKVSLEEFDQSFTGIALVFEKGDDFKPSGQEKSMANALRSRLSSYKAAFIFVVLAGLTLVLPGLVIPVFAKIFVDDILVRNMQSWIMPLMIGMLLTLLMRGGLTWLLQRFLLRFETKLALTMSGRFFWHLLHLPMEFFAQRGVEIGDRVSLNDSVAQLISRDLATTVVNCFMIVFYLAVMFLYDTVLSLVAVGIVLLNLLAFRFAGRLRTDKNQSLIHQNGKLMATSMGGLQSIESLKSGGNESDFFAKWAGHQAKVMNSEQKLGFLTLLLAEVPLLLNSLNTAAILSVGSIRVMDGEMSIGMLIAFQSLMTSVSAPIQELVSLGTKVQEVKGEMNRIDDVLSFQAEYPDPEKEHQLVMKEQKAKLEGFVELRNVTFGYSRLEKPLIEDFSLVVKPGSRVALVGGSGSGKSTLAKLVSGLYQPWSGEILFDGKSRAEISSSLFYNSLSVVDQDISLFEGTLYENITMWDSTIPENEVMTAAKDAAIHDDISQRSGGYHHRLQEGGGNFSGGQLQRLEIARALVTSPSILILDEATSALDPKTEKQIDENIRKRGCTCFIIAHRLSTIRDCDEIIVLDRGKVVERGTHNDMKDAGGLYETLIRLQ